MDNRQRAFFRHSIPQMKLIMKSSDHRHLNLTGGSADSTEQLSPTQLRVPTIQQQDTWVQDSGQLRVVNRKLEKKDPGGDTH